MAEGTEQDGSAHWVDAAPFRAQLRHLMGGSALSAAEVATAAGISARLAEQLVGGRNGRPVRRLSRESAQRLLALSVPQLRELHHRREPADRARWELARLRAAGLDHPAIAARLGTTAAALDDLEAGAPSCTRLLAVRLVAAARDASGPACYPTVWPAASPVAA